MDLTPYVDALRRDLALAAEAGGEDARALAERLTAPLESAARLALLDALSAAADEITRELAPGSVDLLLRGREPGFVVTPPSPDHHFEPATSSAMDIPPPAPETDEGGTSRINFRLPEHLKGRIEKAASQAGLSVNAWLVRAAAAALEPGGHERGRTQRTTWGGQRYSGWVR
jgi:hypothetical protein